MSVAVQLPLHAAPVEPPRRLRPRSPRRPRRGEDPSPPTVDEAQSPPGARPGARAGPTPAPVPVAPAVEPKPAGGGGQGTVWVKVPRSFYRRMIEQEPSLEARRGQGAQREGLSGRPWSWWSLAASRGTVKIGSILDDTSAADPLPSRIASPSRRPVPWWPLAGTAAAVAVTLMAAAYRAVVSRRPVPRRVRGRTGADTRSTPPRSPGTPRRSGSASWSGSIPRPPPASCNAGSAREGTSDDTHEDRDRFAAARPGRGGGRDHRGRPRPPNRPRSARRRSCWSAWRGPWPRNCWPSSIARPSRR